MLCRMGGVGTSHVSCRMSGVGTSQVLCRMGGVGTSHVSCRMSGVGTSQVLCRMGSVGTYPHHPSYTTHARSRTHFTSYLPTVYNTRKSSIAAY